MPKSPSYLDQHFLVDEAVINNLVEESRIVASDVVLEIGAGKGALTTEIARHAKHVYAIEKDKSFRKSLGSLPKNVTVLYGDALEELKDLKFNVIISNPPFSMVEPLFKKIIFIKLEKAMLITGKSFLQLLSDAASKWHLIIQLFYDFRLVQMIGKDAFEPEPRTQAALIEFTPRRSGLSAHEEILREIILQGDKKLKNALVYSLLRLNKLTKKQASDKIAKLDISDDVLYDKVWHISSEDFLEVARKIEKII
ncbi:MAG TPA: rRNA adenine N-6-methyltransferase family protein [Candidatus Nanoarchaeia archaeon]|nr:rRNA adenine N-6-methyltransferase family protein [Candidatus Nanoarchaeia archaeon]